MSCPRCSVGLLVSERHRVEVHECPECRGVWLDRGALDEIVGRTPRTRERTSFLEDIFDF